MQVKCSKGALRNKGEKKRVFLLDDISLDVDLCMALVVVAD